jgi:hypothetical protein
LEEREREIDALSGLFLGWDGWDGMDGWGCTYHTAINKEMKKERCGTRLGYGWMDGWMTFPFVGRGTGHSPPPPPPLLR